MGGFAIPQPPGTARLGAIVICWRRSSDQAPGTAFTAREVAPAASESFLRALPSRQTLEVTAPTAHAPAALSETSASALGETASLYVLTRQMTAQVNGIVGGALDTLGDITRTPPAAISSDSAVWGPFAGPLSPMAARLLVTRVAPGSHRFVLELRPRSGQDSEFEPFLEGGSTRGMGPEAACSNVIFARFSAAARSASTHASSAKAPVFPPTPRPLV